MITQHWAPLGCDARSVAAGVPTDQCWRAPRRVSSSFPPRIQPGPPAWPTRLAGPGPADAGVAFVHGANEAKEGGPRRRRGGAPRAGSPLPFPHYIPPGRPLGRGRPAWPTRLADPKSGCERHEGEHVAVLGRNQGHHGQVQGHVRRRWEPEAVDARADAHEVGFVRPMSCPPSRTAIAAPFFVLRARKATHAIITNI